MGEPARILPFVEPHDDVDVPLDEPQQPATVTALSDRFVHAVRKREPKNNVEHLDYVAMLWRMIRALEVRSIDDPTLLPQVVALGQRLAEIVDVTIAASADRYAVDPRLAPSMAECGRILGHKNKQTTSYHRAKGKAIMLARIAAAGVVHINPKTDRKISSEAVRETQAIDAAAEHAVTNLADWLARRAG